LVCSVSAARGEPRDIVVEGDVIADIVAPGAARSANAEVIDASRRLTIWDYADERRRALDGLIRGEHQRALVMARNGVIGCRPGASGSAQRQLLPRMKLV
jgi:hypothetical protein